jgi:hypothetical protein
MGTGGVDKCKMSRKPTPDIASALAAMKQSSGRGRGRKSEIYRWMDARHDALMAAFAKEPPSWTGLARFFNEAGMLSADGFPQTPASVRSTWIRVTTTRTRRRAATHMHMPAAGSVDAFQNPAPDDDDHHPGSDPLPESFTPIGAKK